MIILYWFVGKLADKLYYMRTLLCKYTIALAVLISSCQEKSTEVYTQLEQENTRLLARIDSLSLRLDLVMSEQSRSASAVGQKDLLRESDIDYFKSKGLNDPVEVIKTDLLKNNKLISVKGSLGGRMQFYKERIQVLNHKWVLAYFEDGHSAGEMLLEFEVSTSGDISWKVLTTSMI
jgi:hypothetical protein